MALPTTVVTAKSGSAISGSRVFVYMYIETIIDERKARACTHANARSLVTLTLLGRHGRQPPNHSAAPHHG